MTKVIVDRSHWQRGEGSANSYLYNPETEKMCCIGFVGITVGVPQKILEKRLIISALHKEYRQLFPYDGYTRVYDALYGYNDSKIITNTERENRIIEYGLKIEIEFEFVG